MKGRSIAKISVRYRRIVIMGVLIVLLVLIGVVGFMHFENLGLFDALWLMIVSILTIGYGDIYPRTESGRLFTLFVVPAGITVFSYGFGTAASYFLEKHFPEKVREKRMEKEVKKLNDHIIICGSGNFAKQVYDEIRASQPDAAIIFISEDHQFMEDYLETDTLRIVDNPTEQRVLERAGALHARALFAAMQDDADNVFITLTVKNLNEDIDVAARANQEGSETILEKAGAKHVVNPYAIGGRELAMSILEPYDMSRIRQLRSPGQAEFSISEVKIVAESHFVGHSLHELDIQERFGVLPVGILRNGELIGEPSSGPLHEEDVLLLLGTPEQIDAFERE
ncbi:potassium channel family protein [Sporosarcina ureae]|uniref:potassium channel family protein n=1 Tax=Sporosarcina ureae TaxID=1571 RepID=UPI0009DC72DF|nr:NAD-binding protein [Sporosarcina ureae]ARF16098.1 hypothetical protein SporoP17a_01520 [Sporosarcina ureae]